MEEKPIYDFTDTSPLDQILGETAEGAEWEDEIFVNPLRHVVHVPASQVPLFFDQHPDTSGWIRVLWGTKLTK